MKIGGDLHRVVVTGMGVVSSVGIGKDESWKNFLSGKSGISKISAFDTSKFNVSIGGEVKNFDPLEFIRKENLPRYGRASQLGIAAAKLAIQDARLSSEGLLGSSIGIIVGTTNGESQVMERINDSWLHGGEEEVDSLDVFRYPGNVIALNIARENDLDADCIVIPTACAAGNYAIGYGYDRIQSGELDIVFAGGTDALSRSSFLGFSSLFALAPEKCQPFDKNRKGIVIGEGASILVLESLQHALDRNATIYAEIFGYGLSCDASHMTIPNGDGVVEVMKKALESSGIGIEQVDYISAHGTGTPMNDKIESKAINRVFGDREKKVAVSSIKSMLGHTMGAASALEAMACVMAIYDSKVPPTINHEAPDEECPVYCVPNKMKEMPVNFALNNSFAFGGNNACLVFGRYQLNKVGVSA